MNLIQSLKYYNINNVFKKSNNILIVSLSYKSPVVVELIGVGVVVRGL